MRNADDDTIRVMTYNIRACLGIDRKRSLKRIARVIAHERPDVVALQEVDFNRKRSGNVEQAAEIAEILNMHHQAPHSFREGDGHYGNAVLSRYPIHLEKHDILPHLDGTEPRSAMRVTVEHQLGEFRLLNTHLSFRRSDRPLQIDALLDPAWIGEQTPFQRTIICGDLNCAPRDKSFRKLVEYLSDTQVETPGRPKTTWPTRRPFRRIDHILISPDLTAADAYIARSTRAKRASDHYPVVADIRITL